MFRHWLVTRGGGGGGGGGAMGAGVAIRTKFITLFKKERNIFD